MTPNNMHAFIIFVTSIFMFFAIAGCDGESGRHDTPKPRNSVEIREPASGTSQKVGSNISYQLPSGWEFKQDEPLKARLLDESKKPDVPPDMILEMIPWKPGNEVDAQNMALDLFVKEKENNPESNVNYFEVDLGGETLYVLEQETEEYWGLPYWYTSAYFEKEGYIINIILFDQIQNQKQALDMAIKTLKLR